MFRYLRQIWHTKDLRTRILVTLGMLVAYRIISHLPIPGADPFALSQYLSSQGGGGLLGVFASLTGGAVDNFSIALLGLSPYINASIIIQLCTVIFPKLEALSKEGQQGQQQLNRYTRWLSLPLAFLQSYGFLLLINRGGAQLVDTSFPGVLLPMLFVTMGSVFIMWMGELITEKGIGNGISIIIFTGIVFGIPANIQALIAVSDSEAGLVAFFVFLTVALLIACIIFTDAHRQIPLTYANQGAGRGVQGGIPIRLNQAGMVPIIFAVSLITLPSIVAQFLSTAPRFQGVVSFITAHMNPSSPGYAYIVFYFALVLLFNFFYVSVTFKPADLAESIQKRGGFVPGVRPGQQTAAMLERVSNHLNLWGGIFLGLIAIVPLLFTMYTKLPASDMLISGSGLIILVGVVMELIRQVNASMLAHDYEKLV